MTLRVALPHNEQGRRERLKAPLLGTYVRRWTGWARAGLVDYDLALANTLANPSAVGFASACIFLRLIHKPPAINVIQE